MTSHTLAKDKISPSRWHYAISLIEQLRQNFSVKEVSRIAQGNSEMHGWADTALRLRGVVAEHHIRNMEDYLRPRSAKKRQGMQVGDARLTTDQQKTYRKLVLRLREIHGWDNPKIAAAIGLGDASQVSRVLNNGKGSLSKLQAAQAVSDLLERAAAVSRESSELNGHPDPMERRGREPSGADKAVAELRRGQERAAAPTPTPAPAALEAPRAATEDADPVRVAQRAGRAFVAALEAMQGSLPKFAQAGAADLRKRAVDIILELGEEK